MLNCPAASRNNAPLGWLERVPTYKDQIEVKDRDCRPTASRLSLMQAADILIYRATMVPV